ncbi:complex I subunit 4 family protein [Limisphaera sp. VF-2]|uniref:complex I subunit 4 family protein n=1 Tax=Limisphaera sp. VF-2 TaxID=3400418 RepID=UPI003C145FD9
MELQFSQETVPVLRVLIFGPLAAALLLAVLRRESWIRAGALAATLALAVFSLKLWWGFDRATAAFQWVERARWIPWLGAEYFVGVDGISVCLVLLTTLLMPLCVLCSWRYITSRVKEFFVCLLVMESAMVGVFTALDLVLFFVFWEAMLIPMALLIGIWGGPRRVYAALKFFLYTMAGSVFLLVGIVALYVRTGTFSVPDLMLHRFDSAFQSWVFLAFALSFAVKVPMFPLHTWLPAAHVEAPTAGSVVLASILLKMGTYGFLRFCLPLMPEATRQWGPWVLGLSVVAMVYGALAALAQSDLKRLVAYSSVAHMGFATFGIFALNPEGIQGSMLVMINHGVTTGALFMAVGLIYERLHTRELDRAAGLGRQMPVFAAFLGIFALSSMAFPGTNSFIGEWLVLTGAVRWVGSEPAGWMLGLLVGFIPAVVLAAAYNLRMLQRVAYGSPQNPDHRGIPDLGLREIAMLLPLLAAVVWIGLHPQPVLRMTEASVEHLLRRAEVTRVGDGPSVASRGPVPAQTAFRPQSTGRGTGLAHEKIPGL